MMGVIYDMTFRREENSLKVTQMVVILPHSTFPLFVVDGCSNDSCCAVSSCLTFNRALNRIEYNRREKAVKWGPEADPCRAEAELNKQKLRR